MRRKGILLMCGTLLVVLSGIASVSVAETADEIATMLTWWDEVGSDWEKAGEFIEFAGVDQEYLLADNTVEKNDEQQQQ